MLLSGIFYTVFLSRQLNELYGCRNHNIKRKGIKANILSPTLVDIVSQWYNLGSQSVLLKVIGITWDLIRNVKSQSPLQTTKSDFAFYQDSQVIPLYIKIWEILITILLDLHSLEKFITSTYRYHLCLTCLQFIKLYNITCPNVIHLVKEDMWNWRDLSWRK